MSLTRYCIAALLIACVGCGDDAPPDAPLRREPDASSFPAADSGGRLDAAAAGCDPLGLEAKLEPTTENLERALQQDCFHAGEGRRTLVFEALCQRDLTCGKNDADCRGLYEARWQARLRPRGLSVPCADALLDAMSCLARARCDDARACDAANKRADTTCDPNTPLPGSPMCPPLPEGRAPTKGPIPDDAINEAGRLDQSRVPDFIPALDQQGAIAGYVRHCALAGGGAIPVYADDLKTVVGYMIPEKGFVPGPLTKRQT